MRSFPPIQAACCVMLMSSAVVASSPASTSQVGEEFTRMLLGGKAEVLASRLSPKASAALGGSAGVKSLAETVKAKAGEEVQVLEQRAYQEGEHTTYYRISRFEKLPSVLTRWVWNDDGQVVGVSVTPMPQLAASPYDGYRDRTALHLPMLKPEQGAWYVAWGGRGLIANKHAQAPDQRFAYDFVAMRGRRFFDGDGSRNEDHYCFGELVVAPARGRISVAQDGEADNVRPGVQQFKSPPGNHVIVDHDSGEHSLIAHLRLGSVRVKAGQEVSAGDVLGACGNSGKSELPHVHYHLQMGSSYGDGVGLPVQFASYFLGGKLLAGGEPARGDVLMPDWPRQLRGQGK